MRGVEGNRFHLKHGGFKLDNKEFPDNKMLKPWNGLSREVMKSSYLKTFKNNVDSHVSRCLRTDNTKSLSVD